MEISRSAAPEEEGLGFKTLSAAPNLPGSSCSQAERASILLQTLSIWLLKSC